MLTGNKNENSNYISNNFYGFNGDSDPFSVGTGHRNAMGLGLNGRRKISGKRP
jgi:hypothetical protein